MPGEPQLFPWVWRESDSPCLAGQRPAGMGSDLFALQTPGQLRLWVEPCPHASLAWAQCCLSSSRSGLICGILPAPPHSLNLPPTPRFYEIQQILPGESCQVSGNRAFVNKLNSVWSSVANSPDWFPKQLTPSLPSGRCSRPWVGQGALGGC